MSFEPSAIGLGEMALRVVARPGAWFALLAREPDVSRMRDRLAEEITLLDNPEPKRVNASAGAAALAKLTREAGAGLVLVGGVKDLARNRGLPRFHRKDGAWFHFTLTVAERPKKPLDLISYDFELCFPESSKPAFVRFDLNPPGHDNEDEGLRSHVHPGTDNFSAPAPWMSPLEILDVLLYDLGLKRAKARA